MRVIFIRDKVSLPEDSHHFPVDHGRVPTADARDKHTAKGAERTLLGDPACKAVAVIYTSVDLQVTA